MTDGIVEFEHRLWHHSDSSFNGTTSPNLPGPLHPAQYQKAAAVFPSDEVPQNRPRDLGEGAGLPRRASPRPATHDSAHAAVDPGEGELNGSFERRVTSASASAILATGTPWCPPAVSLRGLGPAMLSRSRLSLCFFRRSTPNSKRRAPSSKQRTPSSESRAGSSLFYAELRRAHRHRLRRSIPVRNMGIVGMPRRIHTLPRPCSLVRSVRMLLLPWLLLLSRSD